MVRQVIRNMEDFALAIGISRPTISKYFDNKKSVRVSTQKKIEDGIVKYGFQPNIFASSVNRRNPKNIGVIVPQINDPFYAELVRCVEMECLSAGYWAIVLSSYGDIERENQSIAKLFSLPLAGVLVAPLGFASKVSAIRSLNKSFPLVCVDAKVDDDLDFVGTDNDQSIGMIVDYLMRSGDRPCFLDMPEVNQNAFERRTAYISAMKKFDSEPVIFGHDSLNWNFERAGYDKALEILDGHLLPTRTLLCANDRLALGATAAAFHRGIQVGRGAAARLRVAGHDDHPATDRLGQFRKGVDLPRYAVHALDDQHDRDLRHCPDWRAAHIVAGRLWLCAHPIFGVDGRA